MELRRLDSERELERLREFLSESDPGDYLLEDIDEWAQDGRLWVGEEGGRWVTFGRIHDLGHGQGWVSALRVGFSSRGQGLGGQLLSGLLSDGHSIGLNEFRAVIEDGNRASRALFAGHGFRPICEMALRRAKAGAAGAEPLYRARPGVRIEGQIGWVPSLTGRVDLLPGSEGGRFGRWDPRLTNRWITEGKLYVGPGLAAAVQVDWLREPRTMWANPLQGEPKSLLPAIGLLAKTLGQEEWQAFLPSTEDLRRAYASLGLSPHAHWGDRLHLYERTEVLSASI
jgi:GNAT superfamily N-acetyltransferase